MSKKAIFLDIDGTLVSHQKGISDKVKLALSQARENGHLVFLCTGRNKNGIQSLMNTQLFDGAVASSGGYIYYNDQVIYHSHGFSLDDIKLIKETFRKAHIFFNLECDDVVYEDEGMSRCYMEAFNGSNNSEIERLVKQHRVSHQVKTVEEYQGKEVVQTICYICEDENQVKEPKDILSQYFHFLTYKKMGTFSNGELMVKGIDKGSGIKKMIEALDIKIEDTIGFGDSMNDLEMIQTCHQGIVMDNGDDKIKSYATSVCESVEDDGIYYELKRQNLI